MSNFGVMIARKEKKSIMKNFAGNLLRKDSTRWILCPNRANMLYVAVL